MPYRYYTLDGVLITDSAEYNKDNFSGIHVSDIGTKFYRLNSKRHRLDGPAIERLDGQHEWFINGKQVTELEHKLLVDTMKLKGLL